MSPKQIIAVRESMNYTQAQFGKAFGVRQATVSEWERGKVKPSRLAILCMMLVRDRALWKKRAETECDLYGELLKATGTFHHASALIIAERGRGRPT